MAAFRKIARHASATATLASVLDSALVAYTAEADADPEPATDAPVATVKRGRGRPVGSKDSKPRKSRKSVTVKPSAKVKPSATDTVPCVACFSQTPRAGATFYADTQSFVCPTCEAEANEPGEAE
jgi:hypothetical protein